MNQPIIQVDAFTDRPFAGNPAAVCILAQPRPDAWMQAVANEMNLAETAFLVREADGYRLRWFTPAVEVDLCGHATLASAHVLWDEGYLPLTETARFHTRSGLLTARRAGDRIELDFPAEPVAPVDVTVAETVASALGAVPRFVGRNRMDLLAELPTAADVRALAPDRGRLLALGGRGVIVTAASDVPGHDFVSRFFAPRVGIDEDPVTGSAHCCLSPYWSGKLGRNELTGYQASARGGTVRVRVSGERVVLGGQAVTTLRGELSVIANA
jgi:PhzF family phenazine biosynthesis protein